MPEAFLAPRTWSVYRQPPAPEALARAVDLVRGAQRPLIVAGGGVIYSAATAALRALVDATGIPVAETQAGRGALLSEHPLSLGAVGATGTAAANRLARDADLVIGVGTRWSDFTTASKSAFQDPAVRFVNVNVASFDAAKHSGAAAGRRRARGARRAARGAGRLARRRGLEHPRHRRGAGLRRGGRPARGAARGRDAPPGGASSARSTTRRGRPASSCAPRARPRATCTSSGARATPTARATTSSTATRAWATRSRAAWGSSSPRPSATSSSSSATAPT